MYTLVVAITDAGMRQVVVRAVGTVRGELFIRRYQKRSYVLIPVIMLLALAALSRTASPELRSVYFTLTPLVVAALLLVANVRNLGALQKASKWRQLAHAQLLGALVLVTSGTPILLLLETPLGSSIGVACAELTVFLRCRYLIHKYGLYVPIDANPSTDDDSHAEIKRTYRTMSVYSGVAWGQGQLDRVFIGLLAGSYALGIVSVGLAVSRALGDAVASSNANLLRSELDKASDEKEFRLITQRTLCRGLTLAALAGFVVAVPVKFLLGFLLADEWDESLDLVPLLAVAAIPSVLSWSGGVLHVARKSKYAALTGPVVGNLLAFPIALLALLDLRLFAVGVFFREVLQILVSYLMLGQYAPWSLFFRAIMYAIFLAVVLSCIYPELVFPSS